jgi:Polyketide cyclase / dehydrase and lipid transport
MLIAECAVKTTASPEAVWALWADVPNWNRWDHEVQSSELGGPLTAGSSGLIKPKGGPKTRFVVVSAETNRAFHDRSQLPFAQLDFMHRMDVRADCVMVSHRVEMSGPLTFLFNQLFGKKIKAGLPLAMANLVAMAEAQS